MSNLSGCITLSFYIDTVTKNFAWFEGEDLACGDGHILSGLGITTAASTFLSDHEFPKAGYFQLILLLQGRLHEAQQRLDESICEVCWLFNPLLVAKRSTMSAFVTKPPAEYADTNHQPSNSSDIFR